MAEKPNVVVVDGSNLATEGRSLPSLRQLDQAVQTYAAEYPQAEIVVVVDATFEHRIPEEERKELEEAELHGEVVSPPAGAIGRGDAFVLRIAERTGATVLSNDSFQEFHGEHPWLFDEGRLVGGKPVPGVGWIFTPRIPVRGPKSRQATGKARRDAAREGRVTASDQAAELAKAARKATTARLAAALPQGTVPRVGDIFAPAPAVASDGEGEDGQATKKATKKKAATKKAATTKAVAKKAGTTTKKAAGKKAAGKKAAGKKAVVAGDAGEEPAKEKAAKKATTKATKKTAAEEKAPKEAAKEAAKKAPAKKAGSKETATKKKAATKKAAVKKAAAGEAATTKKAAVKKAAVKKTAAGEAATTKKAAAKKATPRKAAAADGPTPAPLTSRPPIADPEVLQAIDQALAEAVTPAPPPADTQTAGGEDGTDTGGRRRRSRKRGPVGPPPAVNEPLAFISFVATYPVGTEVEGEVVSYTSHGAMVEVEVPEGGTLACYVPLAAMAEPPPQKAREVLRRGERRLFVLVSLDAQRRVAELAVPGVAMA